MFGCSVPVLATPRARAGVVWMGWMGFETASGGVGRPRWGAVARVAWGSGAVAAHSSIYNNSYVSSVIVVFVLRLYNLKLNILK